MAENFREKFSALGEKLKVGGTEMGQKMRSKMKEILQWSTDADKMVEEATSLNLLHTDWALNINICDLMNANTLSAHDVSRAIKRRITAGHPTTQYLALILLETCVNNCDKMFSAVAFERILEDMVNIIDDPQTIHTNSQKALKLIQCWGEARQELRYLPVFYDTYKSLKSRGLKFPRRDGESATDTMSKRGGKTFNSSHNVLVPSNSGFSEEETRRVFDVARNLVELLSTVLASASPSPKEASEDKLTSTLVEQCQDTLLTMHKIINNIDNNEHLLYEALNINDNIQGVLSRYEEIKKSSISKISYTLREFFEEEELTYSDQEVVQLKRHALNSSNTQEDEGMLIDLDEMIFGKNEGPSRK